MISAKALSSSWHLSLVWIDHGVEALLSRQAWNKQTVLNYKKQKHNTTKYC